MKISKLITTLIIISVGGLALPTISAAAEEHEGPPVTIPSSVSATWHDIKAQEQNLSTAIAAKKLDGVHEMAFAIRDLVNALPEKSKLDADAAAKLKSNAKFVAALATRLDESGDAKDQDATEMNFQKLQSILKTIESLYPPEVLKDGMGEMKM